MMAGYAAALAVPFLWAVWLTVTRSGLTAGGLGLLETGLLRFVIPALVLLPVLIRALPAYRRAGLWRCLLMITGAGIVFFFIAATGMRQVPIADVGALMPGTMPIFVLALGAILARRMPPRDRLLGAGLVVLGILLFIQPSLARGAGWQGQLMVMGAACCWAVYTHAMRGANLSPWQSVALISAGSSVGLLAGVAVWGADFSRVTAQVLGVQILVQAVLTGLVSLAFYGFAVARLGPKASLFGALTPVLAALLGIPLLGEVPDGQSWLALGVISAGVALAVRPEAAKTAAA